MSRERSSLGFAGLIAAMDLAALVQELATSLAGSLAAHRSLGEALFLHFRFFTILTNWGLAVLLLATIAQALRGRSSPPPGLYGAGLVYILVVGATYELLLRRFTIPQGWSFVADLVLHDLVPALYLVFWLRFAPKRGLDTRHAAAWLAVPAAYLVLTLVAGALGAGYPYFFLDVAKIGARGVATSVLLFLVAFFLLGLGTVQLARVMRS